MYFQDQAVYPHALLAACKIPGPKALFAGFMCVVRNASAERKIEYYLSDPELAKLRGDPDTFYNHFYYFAGDLGVDAVYNLLRLTPCHGLELEKEFSNYIKFAEMTRVLGKNHYDCAAIMFGASPGQEKGFVLSDFDFHRKHPDRCWENHQLHFNQLKSLNDFVTSPLRFSDFGSGSVYKDFSRLIFRVSCSRYPDNAVNCSVYAADDKCSERLAFYSESLRELLHASQDRYLKRRGAVMQDVCSADWENADRLAAKLVSSIGRDSEGEPELYSKDSENPVSDLPAVMLLAVQRICDFKIKKQIPDYDPLVQCDQCEISSDEFDLAWLMAGGSLRKTGSIIQDLVSFCDQAKLSFKGQEIQNIPYEELRSSKLSFKPKR